MSLLSVKREVDWCTASLSSISCQQQKFQHCRYILQNNSLLQLLAGQTAGQSAFTLLQDADIGSTFFDALERVGSIHRSCRNLLSSHHHRAGLELMDAMSTYQETAYERLCR